MKQAGGPAVNTGMYVIPQNATVIEQDVSLKDAVGWDRPQAREEPRIWLLENLELSVKTESDRTSCLKKHVGKRQRPRKKRW